MNILLVTNNLSYRDAGFYTVSLARGLQERNHKVCVAAPPGPLGGELRNLDIPFHTFSFLADPRLEIFRTRAFCSRLDVETFDLLHAHDLALSTFAQNVARRHDLPCFLSMREFEDEPESYEAQPAGPSGVITPNDALREHAVNDLGISKSLVEVIQPGVDLDRLTVKPVFREDLKPVVAMSTPLLRENRVELFPEIAYRITNAGHDVTFLNLGQGELESELRNEVDELGLSDRFIFHCNQDVYFDVLSDIDVLLGMEPRLEMGLLLLQAMGCGKPVITCGAGGAFHVVVDRETGYLVSLSDGPGEIVERLNSLLEQPETAREMGHRARELVEDQFTLDRMVQETVSFFDRSVD